MQTLSCVHICTLLRSLGREVEVAHRKKSQGETITDEAGRVRGSRRGQSNWQPGEPSTEKWVAYHLVLGGLNFPSSQSQDKIRQLYELTLHQIGANKSINLALSDPELIVSLLNKGVDFTGVLVVGMTADKLAVISAIKGFKESKNIHLH